MIRPLISTDNQNNFNDKNNFAQYQIFWDSSKSSQRIAKWFAKILWKKNFQKSDIQEHDDQIVSVVKEVYLPPEQRTEEVWNWILDKDTNFLVHAAYKHRTENIVLICYRWTDFKDIKDIFSDIQIVLWVNWIDERVQESLKFFDEIQIKYPDAKKWICGHSLWWTICYIVTKHRNPERCIVFNPWASPTKNFIWMMKDTLFKKERTKHITTYKIWWDVVSTLSFIWNVKNFTIKSASPLTLHAINSFPELFEKMKDEKK